MKTRNTAVHAHFYLLGALASAVACSGTSFTTVSDDAGSDGSGSGSSGRDAGSRRDAGASTRDARGREDAGRDAGRPDDAARDTGSPAHDATGTDAGETDAAKSPADAAPPPADSGVPCAQHTADGNTGVFLWSGSMALPGQCGGLTTPCPDLASAIAAFVKEHAAHNAFTTIFVGQGTYTPVAPATSFPPLPEGVTLQGGWNVSSSNGISFTPVCPPSPNTPNATFKSSSEAVLTVGSAATPSASTITLQSINVVNTSTATTATAGPGASFYGVSAVGSAASKLVLENVSITVPPAGNGSPGAGGSAGAPGAARGCAAFTGAGSPGEGAGTGAPAAPGAGTYGPSGFAPAPGAVESSVGLTGGTPASVQTCAPSYDGTGTPGDGDVATCGAIVCPVGSTHCTPSPCAVLTTETVCAGTTLSGCGGVGGTGGYSGGGGGSSIALFLWNEAASIDGGALVAGSGGQGGAGGAGGTGGAGAAAGPLGASANYFTTCSAESVGGGGLVCLIGGRDTVTAEPASPGFAGGAGGGGAGGPGGDSYSYYAGPLASPPTVTLSGSPLLTQGAAGQGGTGGASNGTAGASGYSAPTNAHD